MSLFSRFLFASLFSVSVSGVNAHEYWMTPNSYSITSGDLLEVNLRNGEDFKGVFLPYYPPLIERFELHAAQGSLKLGRTIGDKPAANLVNLPDGLMVVLYESKSETIDYSEEAKFRKFVDAHDLGHLLDGTSMTLPINEKYRRFVKMLVNVGSGAGADKFRGMELEFIAITNPYFPKGRDTVTFELRYQGKSLADRQVELFERPLDGGDAVQSIHRTDASGRVKLAVKTNHEYLVNSVVLRALEGAVPWESLWASLTFANIAE